MVGLYRISEEVEIRKLLFLYKILSLPEKCITKQIFTRKYILFVHDKTCVKMGFIPDICNLLAKYNLCYIINDYMACKTLPTKASWKCNVKRIVLEAEVSLWNTRLSNDPGFLLFRILHPAIQPSLIYKVFKNSTSRNIMLTIARLWCRPCTLSNLCCDNCNAVYQEELMHILAECPHTNDLRITFKNDLLNLVSNEFIDELLALRSIDFGLRLLGAPLPPLLDLTDDVRFLMLAYNYIVNSIRKYFEPD